MPTSKRVPLSAKVLSLVAAAVLGVMGLTLNAEGTVYKAYKDPVGIWTICNGHTKGVKLGDVATKAQCRAYYIEDMTAHMVMAVQDTPTLVENPNAMKAAGDFSFNAGPVAYANSPMTKHFSQRKWTEGCNSFSGYYINGTFDKPQANMVCKPHSVKKGKYLCQLKGLINRRENEKKLCLTGNWQ